MCFVILSFGLVLHALQVLVTSVCSQSHLPNHCMNGVVTAKRLYSAFRVSHQTLKSNLGRIQMQEINISLAYSHSPRAKGAEGAPLMPCWHHLRWAGKGEVLGEACRALELLRAPPPDLLVLCYSTICQHDPARPITTPFTLE